MSANQKHKHKRTYPDGTLVADIEFEEFWLGMSVKTTTYARIDRVHENVEGTLWTDRTGIALNDLATEEHLERKLFEYLQKKYGPPSGVRRYVVDVRGHQPNSGKVDSVTVQVDDHVFTQNPHEKKRELFTVLKLELEPPEPGYIYLMSAPADGAQYEQVRDGSVAIGYKIGVSKDPNRRHREISNTSRWGVRLLHTVKCDMMKEAYTIEAGIHWALSNRRSDKHWGQEWYYFDDPIGKDLIEALQQVEDARALKEWTIDALMSRHPFTRERERFTDPGEPFSWEGIPTVDKPIDRDYAERVLFDRWDPIGERWYRINRDYVCFPTNDEND